MTAYVAKRLLYGVAVMLAVTTLVFFLMRAIPGDPIRAMVGFEGDPEAVEQIKKKWGFDKPLYVQYGRWFGNVLRGDLGNSIWLKQKVTKVLTEAFPRSLSLVVIAFTLSTIIAIPIGIISAVRRYSLLDYVVTFFAFLGLSMPAFWFGIILIILFASKLQVLPAFGYEPLLSNPGGWFRHIILPAVAVGVPLIASLSRMTRSAVLEELKQDYIDTARSKGVTELVVVLRHALRNAMIPIVTVMGINLAVLFRGTVVIENVFAVKGLGRMLISGAINRDYPLLQGTILIIAGIFVLTNILVDILYTYINPKIRYH